MTQSPRRRAWQALTHVRTALQRRDRAAARRWARRAVQLAPTWDVPWAILGVLTRQPKARQAYLRQAQRLNPHNRLAARYLAAREDPEPPPPTSRPARSPAPPPRPRWAATARVGALAVVLLLALAGWSLTRDRATASRPFGAVAAALPAAPSDASTPSDASAMPFVASPATATATPWLPATNTPSPTPTGTPTPTPTPSPSATPTPTDTSTPTPLPSPTPTASATPWVNPPPEVGPDERWILVDLSEQHLYALEGDRVVRSFVVSTGRWPTLTVTGTFRIWIKLRSTPMVGPGYNLPNVPYTMYFYEDYGIHGAYWHDNFGVPMSHGCVNMRVDEARWLFDWASVGTVVHIVP